MNASTIIAANHLFKLCSVVLMLGAALQTATAVNVSEPPDFPNGGAGPATVLGVGANVFSGSVSTPNDSQDRFDVTVPVGFRLLQATKDFSASGGVQSPNVSFNGEDRSGTGTGTFTTGYPLGAGTYSAIVSVGFSIGNTWSVTLTVGPSPNYSVSTLGGVITVTDNDGNSDTLSITNPVAGNIRFLVPGRTFAVNGGALLTNDTGNLSLSGITDIVVDCANGNDTVNVSSFSGTSPGLTIYGGSGNDTVNFNGDINFAAGRDLDVELETSTPGDDFVFLAPNVNLVAAGAGTITIRASKSVSLSSGSSLEVVNGDLTVEANQQTTPATGSFNGVQVLGATIKSSGTGTITVNGRGGNDPGGYQLGVNVDGGGKIIGGTGNYVFIRGDGGASTGIVNRGVTVYGAGASISSSGASVFVSGSAGQLGSGFGIGVSVIFAGEIGAGGNGLVTVTGNGAGAGGGFNQGIELAGTGSRIFSSGRDIAINGGAGPGASYGVYCADSALVTTPGSGGSIEFYCDSLSLDGTVNISTTNTASHVRFKPAAPSTKLDLGGADTSGFLGVANQELAQVNTANLEFYNPSSSILISASITNLTATNLTFLTAPNGLIPRAPGVDLFVPAATVNLIQSSPLAVTITGNAVDSGYDQLSVVGKVNLASTSLLLAGSFSGNIGDSFTLINNDGSEPIIGTFQGAPENAIFFLNGQPARIHYAGGTGNDVTLERIAATSSITGQKVGADWLLTGASGMVGTNFTIQATTNFVNWTNLATVTSDITGKFIYNDINASQLRMRFYRARY